MWLLDNAGDAFQGRRLWLRPGKRYLFGRTKAEAGQLVISDKTISRRHLTIAVGRVQDGDGTQRDRRSVVTVEDLKTKIGTVVNGTQIRGQSLVLTSDVNQIKMGHMADLFRITWYPVVLSFSFTNKELRADPWTPLAAQLEQLDVKYIAEYDRALTTHVVAKKRNTSKGLQALINGKHIVMESFCTAIAQAAAAAAVDDISPFEQDFDAAWPNALQHLPPRGDEPSDRPISTYAPDARRSDIFAGYTFVFYDQKQYENLLPPITNGKGKAVLGEVVAGQTQVDDFVRYVKGVAGDRSLGEFEDGGEGRGVVVVRHLPAKGDHVEWFARFSTAVALRLNHRLVDQREFLDAILAVEPGMLRRPLEEEAAGADETMDLDPAESQAAAAAAATPAATAPPSAAAPRAKRRAVASRFKGFDVDLALDELAVPAADEPPASQEGMFMSQVSAYEEAAEAGTRSRKRPIVVVLDDEEISNGIAPTAAAIKRRRIEAGMAPVPALQSPDAMEDGEDAEGGESADVAATAAPKGKVKKEENAILHQARKNREAAEKRAADERAQLAQIPADGVDAADIRRLTLVEEMPVRARPGVARTREQDIADGRWDPAWNGRRNFKKFRRAGDAVGRALHRVIVGLEPVKAKEYGIGDDYWLEGTEGRKPTAAAAAAEAQAASAPSAGPSTIEVPPTVSTVGPSGRSADNVVAGAISVSSASEAEEAEEEEAEDVRVVPTPMPESALPRTRAAKTATRAATRASGQTRSGTPAETSTQTQNTTTMTTTTNTTTTLGDTAAIGTGGKRAGVGVRASPAKKTRRTAAVMLESDSEDDGLQFKFRSRR